MSSLFKCLIHRAWLIGEINTFAIPTYHASAKYFLTKKTIVKNNWEKVFLMRSETNKKLVDSDWSKVFSPSSKDFSQGAILLKKFCLKNSILFLNSLTVYDLNLDHYCLVWIEVMYRMDLSLISAFSRQNFFCLLVRKCVSLSFWLLGHQPVNCFDTAQLISAWGGLKIRTFLISFVAKKKAYFVLIIFFPKK